MCYDQLNNVIKLLLNKSILKNILEGYVQVQTFL